MTIYRQPVLVLTLTLILSVGAGCGETHDERLTRLAQQSLDEQARQNDRLAQQSQQITEASKHLIQADADSRRQMAESQAALQNEIEAARARVDRGREELEQERREMELHRHREPLIAQAIATTGLVVACLLPLLLAGYVLHSVNRRGDDCEALGELLVTEITADTPLLLPPPASPARLAIRPEPAAPDPAPMEIER